MLNLLWTLICSWEQLFIQLRRNTIPGNQNQKCKKWCNTHQVILEALCCHMLRSNYTNNFVHVFFSLLQAGKEEQIQTGKSI